MCFGLPSCVRESRQRYWSALITLVRDEDTKNGFNHRFQYSYIKYDMAVQNTPPPWDLVKYELAIYSQSPIPIFLYKV
jgi:hypothetical protein